GGAAYEREVHLPSVRVAREREAHARRHVREDVGVVREEQHGVIRTDLTERALDVGLASPEVCYAREPEASPALLDSHRSVLKHDYSNAFESARDAHAVEPPVVIAEHGVDAEWRAKVLQLGRYRLGLDERAAEDSALRAAVLLL